MAVPSFDNSNTATGSGVTTLDVSLAVDSGADFLWHAVGTSAGGGEEQPSSVTWDQGGDDEACTKKFGVSAGGFDVSGWYRIAPVTGTKTCRTVWSTSRDEAVVAATSWSSVHQTTPLGTEQTDLGSSEPATVTGVVSSTNDLVIDALYYYENGAGPTLGSGQTQRALDTIFGVLNTGVSEKAGAASVSMSWSWTTTFNWRYGAVSLNGTAAAGGGLPAGGHSLLGVGV